MATQGFSIPVSITHMIRFYREVLTWSRLSDGRLIFSPHMNIIRQLEKQDKTLLRRECKLGIYIIHTHTHMWHDICVSAVQHFPLEVGYTNTCPVGFHPYLMGETRFAYYYVMMSGSEWIQPAFNENVEEKYCNKILFLILIVKTTYCIAYAQHCLLTVI